MLGLGFGRWSMVSWPEGCWGLARRTLAHMCTCFLVRCSAGGCLRSPGQPRSNDGAGEGGTGSAKSNGTSHSHGDCRHPSTAPPKSTCEWLLLPRRCTTSPVAAGEGPWFLDRCPEWRRYVCTALPADDEPGCCLPPVAAVGCAAYVGAGHRCRLLLRDRNIPLPATSTLATHCSLAMILGT